jgi:hypothetical protein
MFYCNSTTRNDAVSTAVWHPPAAQCGWVVCEATGTGGWGFVVRDHAGHIKGSGVPYAASAALTEARACEEAARAAAE